MSDRPSLWRPEALLGFVHFLLKELREWRRSRRLMVLGVISLLWTALLVAVPILVAASEAEAAPVTPGDLTAALFLLVNNQLVPFLVFFGCAGLLVNERASGTLSWNITKPLTRNALLLAKWAVAALMLWLTLIVVPMILAAAVGTPLYGGPPTEIAKLAGQASLAFVLTAFLALLMLTLSVFLSSQSAIIGIGIAALFVPYLLGPALPKMAHWLERLWPVRLVPESLAQFDLPALAVFVASWVGLAALASFGFRRQELS
jgi:ABC-type transport system involved in multi-copper enzyme maturation permease subunit